MHSTSPPSFSANPSTWATTMRHSRHVHMLTCRVTYRNTCIHERSHVVELTFDGPCNNRHASKGGSGTRSLSRRENFTTLRTCSKLVSTAISNAKIHSLTVTGFVIYLVARDAVWWNLKVTDGFILLEITKLKGKLNSAKVCSSGQRCTMKIGMIE